MKIGKVSTKILKEIIINPLYKSSVKRDEILIRPSVGEDCTALNIDNEYCILSTDPITGAIEDIGKLAVSINSNDIASSGAVPIGIMVTILLPPYSDEKELSKIMEDIYTTTKELNMEVIGGHTEVTDAVNRPIISCTVIGKTKNKRFISSGGAKIGQDVVMTKFAGLEGTSIIASDFENKLKEVFKDSFIYNAKNLNTQLSILKEADISMSYEVTCMHDVTEGGILGACWEIAECSKVGIEVYFDNIPVLEETKKICDYFNINPLRLISSGSLLITLYDSRKLIDELNQKGIKASLIGKIIGTEKLLYKEGNKYILHEPDTDELYKIKI